MSTPDENPNVSDAPIFDPFPEPSGYPSGWDLSGIVLEDGVVVAEPAENNAEA